VQHIKEAAKWFRENYPDMLGASPESAEPSSRHELEKDGEQAAQIIH
jgi:hypothetical protein